MFEIWPDKSFIRKEENTWGKGFTGCGGDVVVRTETGLLDIMKKKELLKRSMRDVFELIFMK